VLKSPSNQIIRRRSISKDKHEEMKLVPPSSINTALHQDKREGKQTSPKNLTDSIDVIPVSPSQRKRINSEMVEVTPSASDPSGSNPMFKQGSRAPDGIGS